jgi:hypothetical protein
MLRKGHMNKGLLEIEEARVCRLNVRVCQTWLLVRIKKKKIVRMFDIAPQIELECPDASDLSLAATSFLT